MIFPSSPFPGDHPSRRNHILEATFLRGLRKELVKGTDISKIEVWKRPSAIVMLIIG